MKKLVITAFMLVFAGCAMAQEINSSQLDASYLEKINSIGLVGAVDRRHELRRCLELWRNVDVKRLPDLHPSSINESQNNKYWILLEIGGSSYARYNYVYIHDGHVASSFHLNSKLSSEYEKSVGSLLSNMGALKDDLQEWDEDGSCYFLTMARQGGSGRVVTVGYGGPGKSKTGDAIRAILAIGGRRVQ